MDNPVQNLTNVLKSAFSCVENERKNKKKEEIKKRAILIDIDGTVCEDIPNEKSDKFSTAEPISGAAACVNALASQHDVVFFTARKDEHKDVTEEWLNKHGFNYKYVIYNKPRSKGCPGGYLWIDNIHVKGITYKKNAWFEITKRLI